MQSFLETLFTPPPLPESLASLTGGMASGIMGSIVSAFRFAYFRGVYDGFVAGVLVSLLMAPWRGKGGS